MAKNRKPREEEEEQRKEYEARKAAGSATTGGSSAGKPLVKGSPANKPRTPKPGTTTGTPTNKPQQPQQPAHQTKSGDTNWEESMYHAGQGYQEPDQTPAKQLKDPNSIVFAEQAGRLQTNGGQGYGTPLFQRDKGGLMVQRLNGSEQLSRALEDAQRQRGMLDNLNATPEERKALFDMYTAGGGVQGVMHYMQADPENVERVLHQMRINNHQGYAMDPTTVDYINRIKALGETGVPVNEDIRNALDMYKDSVLPDWIQNLDTSGKGTDNPLRVDINDDAMPRGLSTEEQLRWYGNSVEAARKIRDAGGYAGTWDPELMSDEDMDAAQTRLREYKDWTHKEIEHINEAQAEYNDLLMKYTQQMDEPDAVRRATEEALHNHGLEVPEGWDWKEGNPFAYLTMDYGDKLSQYEKAYDDLLSGINTEREYRDSYQGLMDRQLTPTQEQELAWAREYFGDQNIDYEDVDWRNYRKDKIDQEYEANSRYDESIAHLPEYNFFTQGLRRLRNMGGKWDADTADLAYAYANDIDYRDKLDDSTELGMEAVIFAGMTPSELADFNYTYKTRGREAALAVLEQLRPKLNARYTGVLENNRREFATEGPLEAALSWGTARGEKLASALATPIAMGSALLGGQGLDPNSHYYQPQRMANASDIAQSQRAGEIWNTKIPGFDKPAGSILFDALTSSADSAASAAVGKFVGGPEAGKQLAQFIMSSNAAGNTFAQALEDGRSVRDAVLDATADGVIEAFTESASLDALVNPNLSKGAFRRVMEGAFIEGSEELNGNFLNKLYDTVMGKVLGRRTEHDRNVGRQLMFGDGGDVSSVGAPPVTPAVAGNIDLDNRRVVHNDDGSISTERSFSTEIDGMEVLLPTVINGKIVSEEEAIDHYLKTGENLGKFNTPEEANAYAEWLHNRQEQKYGNRMTVEKARGIVNRQELREAVQAFGEGALSGGLMIGGQEIGMMGKRGAAGKAVSSETSRNSMATIAEGLGMQQSAQVFRSSKSGNRKLGMEVFHIQERLSDRLQDVQETLVPNAVESIAQANDLGKKDQKLITDAITSGFRANLNGLSEAGQKVLDTIRTGYQAILAGSKETSLPGQMEGALRELTWANNAQTTVNAMLSGDSMVTNNATVNSAVEAGQNVVESGKSTGVNNGQRMATVTNEDGTETRGRVIGISETANQNRARSITPEQAAEGTDNGETRTQMPQATEEQRQGSARSLDPDQLAEENQVTTDEAEPTTETSTETTEDVEALPEVEGATEKPGITLTLETEDGQTIQVDADSVDTFDDDAVATIVQMAQNGDSGMTVNELNDMLSTYTGGDAVTYVTAYTDAFRSGYYNRNMSTTTGVVLNQQAVQAAQAAGRQAAQAYEQARLANVAKAGNRTRGTFTVDSSVSMDTLDANQQAGVDVLKKLSNAIGVNFTIFQSKADENGKLDGRNGWYDQATGTIFLDVNAGRNYTMEGYERLNQERQKRGEAPISVPQFAMLKTAAHELTHFIENSTGNEYAVLRNFMIGEYRRRGINFDSLVENMMTKRERAGAPVTREGAIAEVIADGCEMMLQNPEQLERLAKQDQSLFQKMTDFVSKLAEKVKAAFTGAADPSHMEARALMDVGDDGMWHYADEMQRMWYQALLKASGQEITADNLTVDKAMQIMSSTPAETVMGDTNGPSVMPDGPHEQDSVRTYDERTIKNISIEDARDIMGEDWNPDVMVQEAGMFGGKGVYLSTKEITKAVMRQHGFSDDMINKSIGHMDDMAKWMRDVAVAKFTYLGIDDINDAVITADPATGKITASCRVNNGEYPINIDFTKICNKRLAFQTFLNKFGMHLTADGKATMLETINLNRDAIFEMNKVLRDNGYETACLGCFVEARRYSVLNWADKTVKQWNNAVKAVVKNPGYYDFAKGHKISDMTADEIRDMHTSLVKYSQETYGKNVPERFAKLAKSMDPSQLKLLKMADLVTVEGQKNMRTINSALATICNTSFGSNQPKTVDAFTPYNSEITLLPPTWTKDDQSADYTETYYRGMKKGQRKLTSQFIQSIGGVRSQSFSDFMIQHVFDCLQKTNDIAAKKLTAQAYTKEIGRAVLFGRSGEKVNLSVMFDILAPEPPSSLKKGSLAYNIYGWEHAGMVENWQDPSLSWEQRFVVGDYVRAARVAKEYKQRGIENHHEFTQSFPWGAAVAIEHDPAYSPFCGIIGVGLGYNHIMQMLACPDIPYIIPYHSSGMPAVIKKYTNINRATDYTPVQWTRQFKGFKRATWNISNHGLPSYASVPSKVKSTSGGIDMDIPVAYNGKHVGEAHTLKELLNMHNGDARAAMNTLLKYMADNNLTASISGGKPGVGDFPLYDTLNNNAVENKESAHVQTADEYIAWCLNNEMLPEFYEFAGHENYFKLIYDFSAVDLARGGVTSIQQTVRPSGDWMDNYTSWADKRNNAKYPDNQVKVRTGLEAWKADVEYFMREKDEYMERQFGRYDEANHTYTSAVYQSTEQQLLSNETIRKGGVQNSIRESDSEYMDAVNSGDMETAQRLVDEAAEIAFAGSKIRDDDGNLLKVYHGTSEKFTVFDPTKGRANMDIQGMFFSPWELDAEGYGEHVGSYYINVQNPADERTGYSALNRFKGQNGAGQKAREFLISRGYDGVNNSDEEFIVFQPNQIKSSDPVTYDDSGNVIPLSERFNTEEADIRYSIRDDAESEESVWSYLYNLEGFEDLTVKEKGVLRSFKIALDRVNEARAQVEKYQAELEAATTDDEKTKARNRVSVAQGQYTKAYNALEAVNRTDDMRELEGRSRKFIKEYLADKSDSEVAAMVQQYERGITQAKQKIDKLRREIKDERARSAKGQAMQKALDSAEMKAAVELERIDARIAELEAKDANRAEIKQLREEYEKKLKEAKARGLKGQELQRAFDLGELRDQADRYRDTIRQIRSDASQRLLKEQTRYRNMIQSNRDIQKATTRAARAKRQVVRDIKWLDSLIRKEDDYRNVPEELKPLVETLLSMVAAHDEGGASIAWNKKQAQRLTQMYANLLSQDSPSGLNFDDSILTMLENVSDLMDSITGANRLTRARDQYGRLVKQDPNEPSIRLQRAEQLATAYAELADIVKYFKHTVRGAQDLFIAGKRMAVSSVNAEVMSQLPKNTKKRYTGPGASILSKANQSFHWNNLTPVYFFRQLRNEGLTGLFHELERGENEFGKRMNQAKNRITQIMQQYHYWEWAQKDGDVLTFKTKQGRDITLTREQAMSLYATWNREHINGMESHHLDEGGFVYPGDWQDPNAKKGVFERTDLRRFSGNKISDTDMEKISQFLTEEQKAYVKAMVDFLSTDMARYGNETSMQLYGIKKYKERYYYPFKSFSGNLYQKSDAGTTSLTDDNRLKHRSFTKQLVRHANNAVLLEDFSTVVASHATEMITYSALTVGVENMNKVLNVKNLMDDDSEISTRSLIEAYYGRGASDYLKTFMQNLNGGVQGDNASDLYSKLISLFKKGAVAGSLSVAMQQPLSIIRAAVHINPKYLATSMPDVSGEAFEEAKQYAGTAAIKDIGGFDVNTGRSSSRYLLDTEDVSAGRAVGRMVGREGFDSMKDTWNDVVGYLPEKMDAMTWGQMWKAVKKEQADLNPGMDITSEEFLTKCGERFNEIMRLTQVYDSVLAKSANIQSKNPFMKTITAFMNEPTLTANMLFDAATHAKENPAMLGKALVTYTLSAIMQAAIKGLFSAARRDDKDKTLMEKWASAAGNNLLDEMNVVTLIPGLKDAWTIFQGGDVARADLSIISDLKTALDRAQAGKFNDPWAFTENVLGALSKFAGIPLKNIMRDTRALATIVDGTTGLDMSFIPGVGNAKRRSEGAVIKYSLQDNLTIFGDSGKPKYYQMFFDAVRRGDQATADDVRTYLTVGLGATESGLATGMRNIIRPLIQSDKLTDDEAVDLLIRTGAYTDQKKAFAWVVKNTEAPTVNDDGTEEKVSTSVYDGVRNAAKSGTQADLDAEVKRLQDYGYTETQIRKGIYDQVKDWYLSGEISEAKAKDLMTKYGGTGVDTEAEQHWTLEEWEQKEKYGEDYKYSKYNELWTAIDTGDAGTIKSEVAELLQYQIGKGAEDWKQAAQNIASAISTQYKQPFMKLLEEGKTTEAANLLPLILDAYEAAGYDRDYELKYIQKNWMGRKIHLPSSKTGLQWRKDLRDQK